MKLNEIYTSSSGFLRADDIQGQKPVVTIESVSTQTNKDKTTGEDYTQLVLTFVGKEKKLGLNFTNANMIAELVGSDDTDNWIGTSIKLYATNVKVGNETKLGIRIMPELPEQAQSVPVTQGEASQTPTVTQPADDSEIPF